ncbi:MAG: hypothetical protein K8R40_12090 [Anaerolineaceae bacterium]|nr:hypothetical protein [Anaerolineaceae bacterium]
MNEDREKFREQLSEIKTIAENNKDVRLREVKNLTMLSDYADYLSLNFDVFPKNKDYSSFIGDSGNILNNLQIGETYNSLILTSGSTAGTALISQAEIIKNKFNLPEISEFLYDLVTSQYSKPEIIMLMNRFRMGKNIPGKVSPIIFFEKAWETIDYRISIVSANDSLVNLRSCLDGMLNRLTQMKPRQEKVGQQKKVLSIGYQLRKEGVPDKTISDWNKEYNDLHKELSGFKQDMFSIDDWKRLLDRGTAFIYNMLSGLESEKLNISRNFQ